MLPERNPAIVLARRVKNPSEAELFVTIRLVRNTLTPVIDIPDGDFHVGVDLVCGGDPVVALPDPLHGAQIGVFNR